MTSLLLALLLVFSGAGAHPLHASYGRMAVEGKVAMCQMRFSNSSTG